MCSVLCSQLVAQMRDYLAADRYYVDKHKNAKITFITGSKNKCFQWKQASISSINITTHSLFYSLSTATHHPPHEFHSVGVFSFLFLVCSSVGNTSIYDQCAYSQYVFEHRLRPGPNFAHRIIMAKVNYWRSVGSHANEKPTPLPLYRSKYSSENNFLSLIWWELEFRQLGTIMHMEVVAVVIVCYLMSVNPFGNWNKME